MPHRPSRRTIALILVPLLVLVPLLGGFAQADGGAPRDHVHGEPRFLDVPQPGSGDVTVRLAVPWQPSASAPSGAAALGYTGAVLMPLPALVPSTGLDDVVKGVSRCAGFLPAAAAAGCAALTRAASCAGLSATSYCVVEDQPFAGAIHIGVANGHTPLLFTLNVKAQPVAGTLADAVGVAYRNDAWAAGSFAPTVAVDFVTALPAVAKVVLRTAAANGGSEVTRLSTTTDPLHTLHAAGFGADGAYLGDQEGAVWSISNSSVARLSGTTGPSVTLDPRSPGTALLDVVVDGVTARAVVDVAVGTVAVLKLRDAPQGEGKEVGSFSLRASEAKPLFAAGYDADANLVGDLAAAWTVLPEREPCGAITTTPSGSLFEATRAGIADCHVVATAHGLTAQTGSVTVLPGEGLLLGIFDDGGQPVGDKSLATSEELRLHAFRQDTEGNLVHVEGDVSWGVVGGCGTLNVTLGASVTFDPTRVTANGPTDLQCRVHASTMAMPAGASPAAPGAISAGEAAWTGVLTVTPGPVTIVKVRSAAGGLGIEVGSPSVTTDQLVPLFAAGYDADLNFVADQATATWTLSDADVATLSAATGASVTLDPKKPGTTIVTATLGMAADSTGAITITPGRFAALLVRDAPGNGGSVGGEFTLDAGETLRVHAAGYDADLNYLDDVAAEWTVLNGCGTVEGDGSSAVFTAGLVSHPDCRIQAAAGDIVGTSARIVLANTPPVATLVVRDEAGVAVGAFTRSADHARTFYAAGFSESGAFVGNQSSAVWTATGDGGASCGTFTPETGASTHFTPTRTGVANCRVTATLGEVAGQTGVVTVNPGKTSQILVETVPSTMVAGTFPGVRVRVYDVYGNLNTSYAGTVSFALSGMVAAAPKLEKVHAPLAFTATHAGDHTFAASAFSVTSVGKRWLNITATVPGGPGPVVSSHEMDVTPADFAKFGITYSSTSAVAGVPFAGATTVKAWDTWENTVTHFVGDVTFGATDDRATVPAARAFGASDAGVVTLPAGSFTFRNATMAQKVSATSGAITSTSTASVTVTPAPAAEFLVTLPGQTFVEALGDNIGTPTMGKAGATFDVQIRALDEFGNVLKNAAPNTYNGNKNLVFATAAAYDGTKANAKGSGLGTATDFGTATSTTFSNGVGTYTIKLYRAGAVTFTVTDTTLGKSGTTSTRTVAPGDASAMAITVDCAPSADNRACIIASEEKKAAWKPKIGQQYVLHSAETDEWDNVIGSTIGVWAGPNLSPRIAAENDKVLWTPANADKGSLTLSKPGHTSVVVSVEPTA